MIYLDNASVQQPKPEVIDEIIHVMKNSWANPSSSNYEFGLESARIINQARINIANEINCSEDEIIFTSGGSESNSLAIDGWLKANKNNYNTDYFVTSVLEHSSILNNPKARPIILCDEQGFYKTDFINEITDSLVSLQISNSEIGVIQDLKQIIEILHKNNNIVHTDAVAAFGKIPINIKGLNVDLLSATGQKIGGGYGAGFLYVKKGIRLSPIIYGTQNNGLNGGSYNVFAIAGLSKAVELISFEEEKEVKLKRNYLLEKLLSIDGVCLNGTSNLKYRLPNNINICIKNIELNSQQFLVILDMIGNYCCSSGSACHSYSDEPSHVLLSIGKTPDEARHSIRITIGNNSYKELDKFYNDFKNIVEQYHV